MCLMAFLFLAVLFLRNQNKVGRWKNWALSIDFWLYIYVLYAALWSHSHRNFSEKLTSSWTCEILSFIVRQCLWYTILNEDAQQTSWLLKIITTTIKDHGKWSNVVHFHCILLLLYTTEHMLELIRLVTARVCYGHSQGLLHPQWFLDVSIGDGTATNYMMTIDGIQAMWRSQHQAKTEPPSSIINFKDPECSSSWTTNPCLPILQSDTPTTEVVVKLWQEQLIHSQNSV